MELQGVIIELGDLQVKSDKFSIREFVIEVRNEKFPDYPEFVKFQTANKNIDQLDLVSKGVTVKVEFNIRGRKWEKDGKTSYFVSLDAWKVVGISSNQNGPVSPEPEDSSDDLPF